MLHMTDDAAAIPDSTPEDNAPHRSVGADLRALTAAGRELAQAELAYQKARAVYAGKAARNVAIASGAALAMAFVALMALVLGLILTLAPILSPLGATVAVVAGLLVTAVLCIMAARVSLQRMKSVLLEPGDDDA